MLQMSQNIHKKCDTVCRAFDEIFPSTVFYSFAQMMPLFLFNSRFHDGHNVPLYPRSSIKRSTTLMLGYLGS